ncbi:peptide ABC transporter permease [Mangrovactinospora gilvigrisea]|uniref:Peptide ABC transporter permease n=1 Tax=Mangrovactinospora gilvigrisea TaxID=1428644 RepID=A0A1J7CD90_9ACTN|nr:peptide ABC transporter permease [Mangrovactinospora gilvigrisea]
MRYFRRRLGFYLFTAWAAVSLNFVLPRFMPGNPADTLLRDLQDQTGQAPTPEQVHTAQTFFGDPTKDLLGQYLDYWKNLAHFDFGVSVTNYPTPVSQLVGQALPWTVLLVGTTTVLAWVLGTALGAYMGWKPGSRFDAIFAPTTTFLHAVPPFWLSLVALWGFSYKLGWFPVGGGYDPKVPFSLNNVWFVLSVLKYGALPACTLVFVGFNGWLFSMRNVMVTTVSEDYVLLARAKGLAAWRVLFKYAARNALLPNITGLAMAIGGILGGTLMTEMVFSYPGLGLLLMKATTGHDFPVMQAVFLMITLAVLVANLIADSVYVLLDPRTRDEG